MFILLISLENNAVNTTGFNFIPFFTPVFPLRFASFALALTLFSSYVSSDNLVKLLSSPYLFLSPSQPLTADSTSVLKSRAFIVVSGLHPMVRHYKL